MTKANMDLREYARQNNVKLWQIAEQIKISEWTLVRRLRKELPEAEKEKIYGIIEKLKSA